MLSLFAQEHASGPLSTYGQFRGIVAVAIAVLVFIGGPILVLGTNVGFRKATAVMLAGLFGYLTLHGFLWVFYPRGPIVATMQAVLGPDGAPLRDGTGKIIEAPRHILGLPPAVIARLPAILLMLGAGALFVILCLALNRLDRVEGEEPTLAD